MAYVSRSPPTIQDGQISRVRFETLAFFRRPSQVWRGLNAGPYTPRQSGLPPASPPYSSWRCAGFIKPAAIQPRTPPSVQSPFAQLRCYLRWEDVSAISSEGVTPPSSLLRAHVPLPLGSLLLRHSASFEESWQVVRSPCCPRELPDVNLSSDAGSRTPAVHRVPSPVFFHDVIGLPQAKNGSASRILSHELRLLAGPCFEDADIPLCSGLQVCSPPRSFLPLRLLPQSSRGFYVRAYRALLPPQETFTLSDSQPCRLLTLLRRALDGARIADSFDRVPTPI